jgi:hypothetical protein
MNPRIRLITFILVWFTYFIGETLAAGARRLFDLNEFATGSLKSPRHVPLLRKLTAYWMTPAKCGPGNKETPEAIRSLGVTRL